ncbi:MAG TPA: acetate/propionate family kinase [Candidatus Limnocylindria bacterium]|jgi:acetate kinase|nr:acetate/propionate family kinase [Candidatus Limnocylindria bacterium]
MAILVLNAGSSSLKASLIEEPGDSTLGATNVDLGGEASPGVRTAVADVISQLRSAGHIAAVGHRVVHGGTTFVQPTHIDEQVVARIRELDALAPLHNAPAADVIDAAMTALPDVAHVACFDTAFHANLPEAWRRYPVPDEWGVRRFGFHGLSVGWSVERAAELLQRPVAELALVVAHLGSGSSATAVLAGASANTSMGMTPLEGLMMGTRAGSLDPGILLHVMREGRSLEHVADALEHGSGLAGASGTGSDVRQLETAAGEGDARAALALEMYTVRAAAGIAAMAASLPRLDALVFTGGIGEHSHGMRAAICQRLAVLGIGAPSRPDSDADAVLGSGHGPAVLRITAREDIVIARQVNGQ